MISTAPEISIFHTGSIQILIWTICKMMNLFRFLKNDKYGLFNVLGIPEKITCYNGSKLNGVTALCALLKRFSYSCRYLDTVHRFGMAIP